MQEKYQCCFCGNSIQDNITSLIVVYDWDKDENLQQEQQLFCHKECLKKNIFKNVPLICE